MDGNILKILHGNKMVRSTVFREIVSTMLEIRSLYSKKRRPREERTRTATAYALQDLTATPLLLHDLWRTAQHLLSSERRDAELSS